MKENFVSIQQINANDVRLKEVLEPASDTASSFDDLAKGFVALLLESTGSSKHCSLFHTSERRSFGLRQKAVRIVEVYATLGR